MTKKKLVKSVYDALDVNYLDVVKIINGLFEGIIQSLARGDKVFFQEFGVFRVLSKKARMYRIPSTGEYVPIPPRKKVLFKPQRLLVWKEKSGSTIQA